MSFRYHSSVPIALFLLLTAPFLLMSGMFGNYYWLDQLAFLLSMLLVFLAFTLKGKLSAPPAISFLAWAFVAYLYLQSQLIKPLFVGEVYAVMAVFFLAALLAWAVRYWCENHDRDALLDLLAWGLFIGVLLQSAVTIIQFFSLPVPFVLPTELHSVSGQMGQRNQLGHYLMWGVLAWVYLWYRHQFKPFLAVSVLLVLTAILGLVNSRTIMAYIIVLSLLLLIWWLVNKRQKNRFIGLLALALLAVLLWQFLIPWLLSFFTIEYVSGAERISSEETINIGRLSEWHKAWLIFLKAPWLGHGWDSYASQSFLLPEANGFRDYELGVLFTHTHNIVLQLLAEVGLIGTLILMAAVVWAVWQHFVQRSNDALFLLALIAISLTHSLLEYPLWYPYFLLPFVVFLALAKPNKNRSPNRVLPPWIRAFAVLACVLMAGRIWMINQSYPIVWFTANVQQEQTTAQKYQNAKVLYEMSQLEPFLAVQAARGLPFKLVADNPDLPKKEIELAAHGILHRPYYYNAFARGLYLYRLGRTQEADEWIAATVRYYPQTLPEMVAVSGKSTHFNQLTQNLLAACNVYRKEHPDLPPCVPKETEKASK